MTEPASHSIPPGQWLTPRRFALVLATLILGVFADVILGGKSFFLRDFGYFGYPLAHYHRECFWRGELPLWNPLNCAGIPFLAQWNTLVLYPGSLIYLLLPLPWSLNAFCLAHFFLAGLGMYCLARHWTGNNLAAGVAGLVFCFNGLTLSCLMWPNNIAALGWLPWVLLLVEQAWRNGGARQIVLAIFIGALQMLCGAPEFILFTWLLLLAFAVGQGLLARPGQPAGFTCPRRFTVIVAGVSGLCAAQLLPFLELLRHSQRDSSFASQVMWAMPPWGWANFLVPLFRCYPTAIGVYFQPGQDWISSYYLGSGAFLLALLAALTVKRPRVCLLAAVLGTSLVLSLGDAGFLYPLLRKIFPPLGLIRFPIKFVTLAAICVPLLAAFGVAHQMRPKENEHTCRPRLLPLLTALFLILMAVITWTSHHLPLLGEQFSASWLHTASRAVLLATIAAIVWNLSRAQTRMTNCLLSVMLLALVVLDPLTHAPWQNPAIPSMGLASGLVRAHWLETKMTSPPTAGGTRAFTPKSAYDQFLRTMISDPANDFLCHRLGLFANANLLDEVPVFDGFYSLHVAEQRDIWSLLYFAPPFNPRAPLMDFCAISHTNNATLFTWDPRPGALPLATAGQRPVFLGPDETLEALTKTNFNPREVVCLRLADQARVTATNSSRVTFLSQAISAHHLQFTLEAGAPALLVLAQTDYPHWQAARDGTPVPIFRANHAFQAIELAAGKQTIELVYRDPHFRLGVWLSLLTAAACGFAWRRKPAG